MEKEQEIKEKHKESTVPPTNGHEREVLPMEKRFNQWAYGGISYFAQAFTGSALTYWIKFAGGRHIYDKMAGWLGPNLISKVTSLRGPAAVKGADAFITVSTMVMMGNLFLIPLKAMEDRKVEIVEKWTKQDNEKRAAQGNPLTPEELQHQEELLEQLKAAPKQNWWSLLTARAFSLATVYGTLFALDKSNINDKMERAFSGAVKKGAAGVGLQKLSESKTFSNVLNLGFFEGFYSMISAGGLFVYSHFIVPPKDHVQTGPITKEFIAPDTSLEDEPPRKNFVAAPSIIPQKSESFAAHIAAETPSAQVAI